jgi:4'-phosphopantetheinyl transferase
MWQTPPQDLTLLSHEIHLWRANLDLPREGVQDLAKVLSADEKARAERFYFEQHRNRFIVGRGTLRTILGRYLGIEPQQLQFEYSPRGKPKLAESYGGEKIQFNVSHSQELALYGFTRDRAIGVDLEYLRPLDDADKIAQRFFSAQESAIINALPDKEKLMAFFRGWTAKEAYLKATGDGLAGSLNRIEVSLLPNEPVRLYSIDGDSQAAAQWSLYSFLPSAEYVATIAIKGHHWTLSCWQS